MRSKIKTIEEIKFIIGDFPRKDSVILCYGCWDIVHPGHLRHLEYAKKKANILICGVTSDKHIIKGEDRPYVPEDLRAKNLEALEIVNYVFIDDNPIPITAIKYLRPDYYAKGFEYRDMKNPKTQEESNILSEYNGKFIFSPADIVYSSSHLLSIHKPKLSIEKLLTIMESEGIIFDDLLNTLKKFKDIKVQVIGDIIIDKYSYCSLLGQTAKTPTFSIKRESEKIFIGGAGIVTKHLRSLGAEVSLISIVGNDDLGELVINDINSSIIIDKDRPTTLKERFWVDGYKLLQVDTVDNRIISNEILREIGERIKNDDLIIFSDFRHGIFNKETIKYLVNLINTNTIKIADSQVSNRWGNILDFKNFDIILPNEKEARFALSDQDTGIRPLGLELYRQSKVKYLILKLGERGILTYRNPNERPKDFFALDSFVENLIDSNGAGDAMLAVTALAYKVSNNIVISSILGSFGAAVVCEIEGNVPITIQQIEDKIRSIEKE